jgi:Tfp pilus assembly protein PilF
MSPKNDPTPPREWLRHLSEAGQWSRLIEIASQALASNPHDAEAHQHIAWAYARTEQSSQMKPHIEFLLARDPNSPVAHHLAAVYHLGCKRPRAAKPHVEVMLREDPTNATYHYVACITALRLGRAKDARAHIAQARQFSPDWAAAAHLEIQMDGARQRAARQAWERIRRLEDALALDPLDPDIHASIGDIYLQELENPREAERCFQQALIIDPTKKANQTRLFDAVRARSLLYRTLSLPARALRSFSASLKSNGLRVLLVLVLIKVIVAFLLWAFAVGAFFWPAATIYEAFILTEVARARGLPFLLRPLRPLMRWPLWARLIVICSLILAGWTALVAWIFHISALRAFAIMIGLFVIHFGLVCVAVGWGKLRSRWGRWSDARRQLRAMRRAGLSGAC